MGVWVLGSGSTVQRIQMLDKCDVFLMVYVSVSRKAIPTERRATEAPGHLSDGHALMSVLTFGKWKSGLSTLIPSIIGHWVCPMAVGWLDGMHCCLLAGRSWVQTCAGFLTQSTDLLVRCTANSTTKACR